MTGYKKSLTGLVGLFALLKRMIVKRLSNIKSFMIEK
jgi:hypothetical protein